MYLELHGGCEQIRHHQLQYQHIFAFTFQFIGLEDLTGDMRGCGDGRHRDHVCTIPTGVMVNLIEVVKTACIFRALLGVIGTVTSVNVIFVNRCEFENIL